MKTCAWCAAALAGDHRGRFCSKLCRQTAFRLRKRGVDVDALARVATSPATFVYADPPYPGLSAKYYRHEDSFDGEVDHPAMIARFEHARRGGHLAGWALSTASRDLVDLLPLCPGGETRVCAWVKPIGVPPATMGLHATWEPIIVVGGRQLPPGVRDWVSAQPARRGGELPGRKPIAVCAFIFDALGMRAGDTLIDLFPGSGVVTRAWAEFNAAGIAAREAADPRQRFLPLVSLLEARRSSTDDGDQE